MRGDLTISLSSEELDSGSAEERATFGLFAVAANNHLLTEPSRSLETPLFHYIGAGRQTVPTGNLETAIDGFVTDILTRLEGEKVRETNLHRLWNDLKMEREDGELARFRRLEAQLGYEPDEAAEDAIRRRLDDAAELGEEALGEIAADATLGDDALSNMMSARDFADIARRNGFEANPNNAITLGDRANLPQLGQVEAWRLGKRFAQRIRTQENLAGQPISDSVLADFAGSMREAISIQNGQPSTISFALDRQVRLQSCVSPISMDNRPAFRPCPPHW